MLVLPVLASFQKRSEKSNSILIWSLLDQL